MAVSEVSLEVAQGEAVSVIGPNGAGKTTMLSAIAGIVAATEGEIRLEGKSLAGLAPEQIVRSGISLVREGRHIFSTLTVGENLRIGTTARRDKEVGSDIEKMLDAFPILRTYFDDPAGRLSGGEQQQLAIARALLSHPALLMLDEPSLGLAPMMVSSIFGVLTDLREQGTTILLVEQNAKRAVEFADRTYVLRSGTVELEGTRESLAGSGRIEELYLGVPQ